MVTVVLSSQGDPAGDLPGRTECEETLPQEMAEDAYTGRL